MSNSYSTAAAEEVLKCPRDKYEELEQLLGITDPDGDPSEEIDHGFALDYYEPDGEEAVVYLKSDTSCERVNPDGLPTKFLVAYGKLLKQNGMKHTTIGVAQTCDRLRPGTHGGYYFRIMVDGRIVEPKVTWPK